MPLPNWWMRTRGPILHLTWRLTGDPAEAEDLAQDAFVKAYEKLHDFDADRSFHTWLYTIALNLTRSHLRSKKIQRAFLGRLAVGNENHDQVPSDGEAEAIRNERNGQVAELLSQLPRVQREAVVLRYYHDFNYQEIAQIAGISLSAAKMRVKRGLSRLTELIEAGHKGGEP